MTIQNIEDVMDRILTLNRNLTEDSLRTLLSASGWDKEDIMEGIHIFKSRSGKDFSVSPAPNFVSQSVEKEAEETASKIHNTYTFNISKEADLKDVVAVKIDPPPSSSSSQEINNLLANTKENTIEAKPENIIKPNDPTTLPAEVKSQRSIGKIIFYILLILILGFVVFYLYRFSNNKSLDYTANINTNVAATTSDSSNSKLVSATDTVPSSQNINTASKDDYALLLEEINKLKSGLASYKNSVTGPKTIVKYISQKGPAGSTGRGISSVTATTTGFIITFTDKSTSLVPYSTTTIFNILNSNTVCFQDPVSPATSSNICLDRASVINLLNK
jgi:cbb3-type cytochrome oxidase subunit 3